MIKRKSVITQLKCDLIGKDSYRGVSLTYSWLANQFGHFSLGFIPCLLVYRLLHKYLPSDNDALRAAVLVSMAWLLFEIFNFLGPLLFSVKEEADISYCFIPAWGNVAFDTCTDVSFFATGAFSAALFLHHTHAGAIEMVLMVLLLLLVYPVSYWYLTKMYLQQAQYPYQFRLSQWNFAISNENKQTVHRFMREAGPVTARGNHLLVFGAKNSGKTSLSVGIATEMSIRRHACVYTTAVKQCSSFYEADLPGASLWGWRDCSFLVIDDFNPGYPIREELITPQEFLEWLNAGTPVDVNKQLIREKNVIWVMGSTTPEWQGMLSAIGVPENKVFVVNLTA